MRRRRVVDRDKVRVVLELRRLDEGEDTLFFADEGGSWNVGIEWRETLPGYFACVAATATPDEFATAVRGVIEEHASHDRTRHLGEARRVASPEQRAALDRRPRRPRAAWPERSAMFAVAALRTSRVSAADGQGTPRKREKP